MRATVARALALLVAAGALAACARRATPDAAGGATTTVARDSAALQAAVDGTWTGRLVIAIEDPRPGSTASGRTIYTLLRERGGAIELDIPDTVLRQAGGPGAVNGKQVTVGGAESATPRVIRVRTLVLSDS